MAEKQIPKSGRKGGTRFPNINLKQAVEYARKLVSKTHTGAQPDTVILKGVFNSAGSNGKIRASALKQYELLEGEADAYNATDLARAINSAPDGEVIPLIRTAFLKPPVFKTIFDTFQNDTVSRSKIRQQVLQLDVHPEVADKCVEIFVLSVIFTGLGTESGDNISISSSVVFSKKTSEEAKPNAESPVLNTSEKIAADTERTAASSTETSNNQTQSSASGASRAQINVTLSLDSTMDPEKLEKYMKILRQYGAIG